MSSAKINKIEISRMLSEQLSSLSRQIPLTKKSVIFLLKNIKSMTHLKQIHAQMFQLGFHQDTQTLNKLMSFCTDPSYGDFLYAEKVFDNVNYRCLFLYNLMIKAYAKKGSFQGCISLFDELRFNGLSADNFTYPFVFKVTGCLGEFEQGQKFHGHVVKSGLEFDTYVCNSIMDMYALLGRIDRVQKLFDEMPVRDVVSWNVAISGHVKCGRFEEALSMFRRMRRESGLRPDEATVVSTLSACTVLKNLELGEEIYRYVSTELGYTTIIGNALLDMYCKCGCLSMGRKIFDVMPIKNVICWTSMVSGYVNCGQLDDARYLFDRSPVKDIVLWTAMINGYVQFNRFDEAVSLFRDMQFRRVKPDKFIVVALLTGCAQLGALEQGRWIHGYIDENGIRVDAVVGTALIEMYAKCGCIEKSMEIFHHLREKDTTSWTSIIGGLAMNGKINEALELFTKMEQTGGRPDDITFIGVLSACSHGGLVAEGRKFFASMRDKYQIEPKLEHYGCLVDLLGRAGLLDEAEELIKEIPKGRNEIIVPLYSALLSACRTYGNVKMGERLAKLLEEIELSDSSVHTLLANIYASAERWEDVTEVRRKMKDIGVRKVPGCSSIEIDGFVHEFIVGDPSHPEMGGIYSMLDGLGKLQLVLEENELEGGNLAAVSVNEHAGL